MGNMLSDPAAETPDASSIYASVPLAESALVPVALYIDADNQSSQNAQALVELLCDGFGARIDRATVAGNADGKVNAGWAEALRARIPGLPIEAIVVPCRKEAADAALILALGTRIAEHRRTGTRVVVVSRDALLLAAAERVKASGCRVYVAYADGEIQTARHPTLATLLLPVAVARAPASAATPPTASAATPTRPLEPRVPTPTGAPKARSVASSPSAPAPAIAPAATLSLARLIEQVRTQCKRQPGGGYTATEVGQALRNLGYTSQAERMRMVESFPGLQKQGQGPYKILVF